MLFSVVCSLINDTRHLFKPMKQLCKHYFLICSEQKLHPCFDLYIYPVGLSTGKILLQWEKGVYTTELICGIF